MAMDAAYPAQAAIDLQNLIDTLVESDHTVLVFNNDGLLLHAASESAVCCGKAVDKMVEGQLESFATDIRLQLQYLLSKTQERGSQVLDLFHAEDHYRIRSFALQHKNEARILLALRPISTISPRPKVLRELWDFLPGLVFLADENANYIGYGGFHRSWLISEAEGFLGQAAWDVLPPENRALFKQHYQQTFEKGSSEPLPYSLEINGRMMFFEALMTAYDGGIVAAIRNLSMSEHDLELSHERELWFKTLSDRARDTIIAHDLDGNILYINQCGLDLAGFPDGLPPGTTVTHFLSDESQDASKERRRRRIAGDTSTFSFEMTVQRPDGSSVPTEVNSTMIAFEDGSQVILIVARDVTFRKQTELALRRAIERNRILINNTVDGVLVATISGRVLEVNPAFCTITGYEVHEVIGHNILNFVNTSLSNIIIESDSEDFRTQPQSRRFESTLQSKQGTTIEAELSVYLIKIANVEPRLHLVIRDMSFERSMQERLMRAAARWQTLYEIDNAIIGATKLETIIQLILSQLHNILDMHEVGIAIFNQEAGSADGYHFRQGAKEMEAFENVPLTYFSSLKKLHSGQILIVQDIDESQYEETKAFRAYCQANDIRRYVALPIRFGHELVASLGGNRRRDQAPFDDDELLLLRNIGASFAVAFEQNRLRERLEEYTRTLEARVKSRTEELAQANVKLRELDQMKNMFISDVSHELRTPVANISMRLQLLKMDPSHSSEHLSALEKQVDSLAQLIEDILQLSRLDLGRAGVTFKNMDINHIVQLVIQAHQPRAQLKGLSLSFEAFAGDYHLFGEPNQISQVVTNLVVNAINYTPEGRVDVRTEVDTDDGFIILTVSDTGIGISEEDRPFIFDRFYRGRHVAKSDIPGNGLGLGIVHDIVSIHHGTIEVESKTPRGTRFIVRFPLLEKLRDLLHESG